jgi:predicted dehydrogenase
MSTTRRTFLQTTVAAPLAATYAASQSTSKPISPNDKIRIALIGAGGMGQGDTRASLDTGATELVAAADIYQGRLTRVQERWGKDVFVTRDYREILARRDIDAVIVATPDHWHSRITIDAMEAGKDVYCEKPMVQKHDQGTAVVAAQQKTGRTFQVGSQYVSNVIFHKVRDLLQAGAIGELNLVEAWLDRNSAIGAWQYTLPLDATPENIDWDRFLGSAPKRPFEPIRLFRWRNYSDYGTGLAGDLYVHLLSGLHTATGSLGPVRVYATGGTRYWKDGRDAPDVQLSLLDYPKTDRHPEFSLSLQVNFASGAATEQFGLKFYGREGVISVTPTSLSLAKPPKETDPGMSVDSFAKAMQDRLIAAHREKYPLWKPAAATIPETDETRFVTPGGYNMHSEHHKAFVEAVRAHKPSVEDAVFGLRAAGPALLCNTSQFSGKICHWDPDKMVVLG